MPRFFSNSIYAAKLALFKAAGSVRGFVAIALFISLAVRIVPVLLIMGLLALALDDPPTFAVVFDAA